MSDTLRKAIAEMVGILEAKQREMSDLKRSINLLCTQIGDEPMFPADSDDISSIGPLSPDEYYGKSPIQASRMYLERKTKPATVEEILSALERGGFDFEAQKWKEKLRLKNLAISLSKNTSVFHRVPSGAWGLKKWYPDKVTVGKNGKSDGQAPSQATETEDETNQESAKEENAAQE